MVIWTQGIAHKIVKEPWGEHYRALIVDQASLQTLVNHQPTTQSSLAFPSPALSEKKVLYQIRGFSFLSLFF